ncbi:Clavaminate synthase-like protein [Hypomontagnella monticulosa]|nr:Clavaminate synthase-like protein [Hypomontagnella monticulosa]
MAPSAISYSSSLEDIAVTETSPFKSSHRSKLCWEGSDFTDENAYVLHVTENHKREVRSALHDFLDCGLDGDKVNPENFPLPTLGPLLRELAVELHEGKGFFVIRGLNTRLYSDEDSLIVFLGISSYIGNLRGKQIDDGSMLGHIHDPTSLSCTQSERPIKYSNRYAEFHNDLGCDILAMKTYSLAKVGGNQLYASVMKIYDHIATTRPDLADELLAPDWTYNIQRRWTDTEKRAVLFKHEGHILSTMFYDALVNPPDGEELPSLTPKQREAIEYFQTVASHYQLSMQNEPGDLTFVNNWAVVHAREAFEDGPDQRRYLLRLWLRNERLGWKLPKPLQIDNHMVFYDDSIPEKWNIDIADHIKFMAYERQIP